MNKIPVILDVDTGLDDALAILLASDCPQLTLLGIAAVSGNAPVENTYSNTRHIVKALDLKIPVGKGAAYPLANRVLHAQEVHGAQGLGPIKAEPEFEKHVLPASQLYEKLLTESEEPVTIIATGPLTNLAHLIQNHPELKPRIKAISFMGGSLGEGNVTRYAEFNAHFDPEALNIVLRSEIPLIMAGLQLTNPIRSDFKTLHQLIPDPLPSQKLYLELVDYYVENAKKRGYAQGGALHDSIAVAAVAYPELFEFSMKVVHVTLTKDDHRGETREEGDIPNVNVLIKADPEKMFALTIDSICHLRKPV